MEYIGRLQSSYPNILTQTHICCIHNSDIKKCQVFKLKRKKQSMKKLIAIAALATAALSTPAMASEFAGPRLEVTAGADEVRNGVDATDIAYGAALGYDLQFGKVVVGAEATAANVFDRADLGAAARLGYTLNKNVLAYTRVGYTKLERTATAKVEGLTVGGGLEVKLIGSTFAKAEYRYTDFDGNLGRHGGLVGFGLRF
jgi:outer membrane immunogenic protein